MTNASVPRSESDDAVPRTRIAIPLHRSWPWRDVVAANIRRLSDVAAITVSDATELDGTLDFLRGEFGSMPGIRWVGKRPIRAGWVGHCNDLLENSTEEFFVWLPHDDDIDADWILHAQTALDGAPGAVLALGPIVPVDEVEITSGGRPVDTYPPFTVSDRDSRVREALAVCLTGDTSFLGAAFRGVLRRELAAPLPTRMEGDEWADILWALRMLTKGSFEPITSPYRKRWHGDNTHSSWGNARLRAPLRGLWIPDALQDLPANERESLLVAAWNDEVCVLRDEERVRLQGLEATAAYLDEQLNQLVGSVSWRLTRPLRTVRSAFRSSAFQRKSR